MEKIKLCGKAGEGMFALVDGEDYEKVNQTKWYACIQKSGSAYAETGMVADGKKVRINMHRFIMGVDSSEKRQVDHINNNQLDNRKSNLRFCTHRQNNYNRPPNANKKYSPYKGVCFDKKRKKFVAHIMLNDKLMNLGGHDTDREAAIAYDKKAMELFGEYAYLNILTRGD